MPSSWLFDEESAPSWLQRCACRVLKAGPVPRHVAFIMDGNRRYAVKNALPNVLHGHSMGFDQLAKTLRWCRDFGVQEVTVYAFSIENFKRSQSEVTGLLDLARRKFLELLEDSYLLPDFRDAVIENGVCFRFFGDIARLPLDMQQLIAKISLFTQDLDKAFINVCVAYTAQDEITRATKLICEGVEKGLLNTCDISEHLVSQCLDSHHSPDPDLLVRTSGEERISDFMLWQCSHTCIYYDSVLWPDFDFWHLAAAVLHYQRNYHSITQIKLYHNAVSDENRSKEDAGRVSRFLEWANQVKSNQLLSLSK